MALDRTHLFCCLFLFLPSNTAHVNNKALFLKQKKIFFYQFPLKYRDITAISVGQKDIGNYNKGRQNHKSAIAYETRSNWFAFGLLLFLFAIIAFQQTLCINVCIMGFFVFVFIFVLFFVALKHSYT